MKILHTVQGYYPDIGGSEELIRRISERLVARGHDVTVFTSFHSDRKFTEFNGVKVRQFPISGNNARGIKGDIALYLSTVRDQDYDIMMNYAAQSWSTDILLPYIRELNGKKLLAPCGYSRLHDRRYKKYFSTLPSYLQYYDMLIYHSTYYQDKLFGDKNSLLKNIVISNFADEQEFTSRPIDFRTKYKLQDKRICLCVSNHFRDKGHGFVIDAFLKADVHNSILVIIGNPVTPMNVISDCYYTCRIAEMLHNNKIMMLTNVPRSDVVCAFHAADIFLFGSKIECSPLVIFESMASNTPWISTPVGNVSELPGGIVVNSTEDMAKCLAKLMKEDSLRKQISESGYQHWQNKYTLEIISGQYESLYKTVLLE